MPRRKETAKETVGTTSGKEKETAGKGAGEERTLTVAPGQRPQGMALFDPWREFDRILEVFRRDMDDLFGFPRTSMMFPVPRWTGEVSVPSVDLEDTGREFILTADMPGVSKDEVQVELDDETVTIRSEQTQERREENVERRFVCQEREYRSFFRSMSLPEPIDPDRAKAEVRDGILRVVMPKARPRRRVSLKVR